MVLLSGSFINFPQVDHFDLIEVLFPNVFVVDEIDFLQYQVLNKELHFSLTIGFYWRRKGRCWGLWSWNNMFPLGLLGLQIWFVIKRSATLKMCWIEAIVCTLNHGWDLYVRNIKGCLLHAIGDAKWSSNITVVALKCRLCKQWNQKVLCKYSKAHALQH